MWSEFFESSLHLQRYLYLGICIVILILATCFNSIGRELFYSLLEKNKTIKDYLIIILGVLMVGLFLFSCGSYIGTLPENDPDSPASY